MFAAALRRDVADGALENLQQPLLHTLAGDVAGDRDVLGAAGDLVDFVHIDDADLGAFHVVVGGLQEAQDDVLDVVADIAGFGQRGGVGDGKRHVEHARQCAGEQRLAGAGRAKQQDVALLNLDVVVAGVSGDDLVVALGLDGEAGLDALVVVVHRDGQRLLGFVLADAVLVQRRLDLLGLGDVELDRLFLLLSLQFLVEDVLADENAVVTDVHARPGDQLADLRVGFPAEAAQGDLVGACHGCEIISSFSRP